LGARPGGGVDNAPMPAAPSTAQPWAAATSSVNADASDGMAQAKLYQRLATHRFQSFQANVRETEALYDARQSAKYAQERLQ
jgi:hypothetical protein